MISGFQWTQVFCICTSLLHLLFLYFFKCADACSFFKFNNFSLAIWMTFVLIAIHRSGKGALRLASLWVYIVQTWCAVLPQLYGFVWVFSLTLECGRVVDGVRTVQTWCAGECSRVVDVRGVNFSGFRSIRVWIHNQVRVTKCLTLMLI